MGLGQPEPGFAYFLVAFGETDHIQTRGLVDLFWRSCWHDFVSTLYEREADVKIMRSRCQGKCEADVKANAKPLSKVMRSRCHTEREADVEKALTRAHAEWKYTRTQTN